MNITIEECAQEYQAACQTIAEMHAAAVGYVGGAIEGVVEDVETLSRLASRLADAVIWMSGAHDFQEGEVAHEGWVRARDGVLHEYLRFVTQPATFLHVDVAVVEGMESNFPCDWPDETLFLGVPI